MTLRQRNVLFKAGIVAALATVGAAVFLIFSVRYAVYPQVINEATQRPAGQLAHLMARFLPPSAPSVIASVLASSVYAAAGIIFIYYYFEKTQCPEMLFFFFFVFSFAFEPYRILLPLARERELPALFLIAAERVLIGGRYFGVFSLFAASVYASGFNAQKQKYAIIALIAVSFGLAVEIPLDGFSWDTALTLRNVYPSLFWSIEISVSAITLASFLISTLRRGTNSYFSISLGVFLIFLGRNCLLSADTWASPLLGIIALGWGTILVCTKLHTIYLWL
jgi:hypothetical protein